MTGPLFICGAPRAGTSALWLAFRKHPEFQNNTIHTLKEPLFYERFLGGRPWGKIETLPEPPDPAWLKLDEDYVRRGVAMIDELLRAHGSGPNGRYLCANPSDVFCIPYIFDSVPEARFVILLRDPLENIWSNVNYPLRGEDGKLDYTPRPIDQQRLSESVMRWTGTVRAADRAMSSPARDACRIIEHRDLVAAPEQTLRRITDLAGIEFDSIMIKRLAGRLRHSSFREELPMGIAKKIAHFDAQRAEAARHPAVVSAAIECLEATVEARAKLGLDYALPARAP